jgi:hypothetical protein
MSISTISRVYIDRMSLPTFKFTKLGEATNNESVNSGLSAAYKMSKSGLTSIKEKAQDTFREMETPEISLETSDSNTSSTSTSDDDGFFSIWTFIKLLIIATIVWFMWSSLSTNGDFHLGMGEVGDKIKTFFKTMEEKGREIISRTTNIELPVRGGDDSDNDSDSDSDSEDGQTKKKVSSISTTQHRPPVPPDATNSSDKRPGFITDNNRYTFLDKADRNYSGPSPRADDSTSVTQKHQSGKGGYCYIGEDRGFRSCVRVEASDKCMSGEVYSRHDICIDPTLRE